MIGPVGSGKGTRVQAVEWRLHYSRHSTGEPVPETSIMHTVVPLLYLGAASSWTGLSST